MDGIRILSILTLISNICFVLGGIVFIYCQLHKKSKFTKRIYTLVKKYALAFVFVISLTATSGSLYLSEIRGFDPCKMCWLQRIFMYPLPIITFVALYKKTRDAFFYVLPLSIIGAVLAGYHYYMQLNPERIVPCSTVGFSVSCSERFFTYFNYITIPWMALSAFVMIASAMFFLIKLQGKKS